MLAEDIGKVIDIFKAAALAVQGDVSARSLDPQQLRATLAQNGVALE